MRSNSEQKCGNCRFACEYDESDASDDLLSPDYQCRRYAPKPVSTVIRDPYYGCGENPIPLAVYPDWPRVYGDEWCGEFQLGIEENK